MQGVSLHSPTRCNVYYVDIDFTLTDHSFYFDGSIIMFSLLFHSVAIHMCDICELHTTVSMREFVSQARELAIERCMAG